MRWVSALLAGGAVLACGVVGSLQPVQVRASSHAQSVALKKTCHYVSRTVHGKKKRVKVCKTVKPKPTPTPLPTPAPPDLAAPLGNTCDVTVAPDRNIYVSGYPDGSSVSRIVELSPTGQHLRQFLDNFPADWATGACYVAVDAAGDVYTTQFQLNTVVKFAPDGTVLTHWSVDSPQGVAIDAGGSVFVAAFNDSKIEKFSPSGQLLATLGPDFHGHRMNTVEGITFGPDGLLYGVNHRDSQIVKMSLDGTWLATWGPHIDGLTPDLSRPGAIAVDAQGNMYVNDGDTVRAVEFSQQGALVHEIPQANNSSGYMAVDAAGNTYSAENGVTKRSPDAKITAVWP